MIFQRIKYNRHFINVYETPQIIMGFTELLFSSRDMSRLFSSYKLVELKQVHSDIIRVSSQIEPGSEGDGIILDQKNILAVIKTADCTPLFFWYPGDSGCSIGGIIHIGWRGLLQGIEKKLLKLLEEKFINIDIKKLNFFLGPSIEKDCYQVGPDLHEMFSSKTFRDDIFSPIHSDAADPGDREKLGNRECKYLLDVKKGIRLSLKESGIPGHQVSESTLCTFCEKDRFPSYRRYPTPGSRIYNFLLLKKTGGENLL